MAYGKKPKHKLMTVTKSDWSFEIKPHFSTDWMKHRWSLCNCWPFNSLSRVHLILPVWGSLTLHASLVLAGRTAGGVWDGVSETPGCFSASPVQERSDPDGLDTAASARHATHGSRTQPPEGHWGTTEDQEQSISYISQHKATFLYLSSYLSLI